MDHMDRRAALEQMKRYLPGLFAAGILVFCFVAFAQPGSGRTWPERAVRITVPFAPGISVDVAARTLADALAKRWNQAVIVENRPGADTMVGTQAFLNSGDDHGLLFTAQSTFTVIPLLYAKVPYDPVHDMCPITLAVDDYLAIAAAPSLEVSSLPGFVKLARHNPTKLNFYAAPGAPYLAYLAFEKSAGIATTYVAYNNPVSAIADLSEGRIHIAVMPLTSVLGSAQTGKVKLLAVTNAERNPIVPEIPTVTEAGYPELAFGGLLGFFGPKNMTAERRERIASDVTTALKDPDVQQRLTKVGLTPRGTTPTQFATILDEQRLKWAAIAHDNNIEPQ
jgi:tripartite-type tricarboxylate transporter receptor subunit TctC